MREKWILGLPQGQLAAALGLESRTPAFGSGVVLPLLTLLYVNLDICKHEIEIYFVLYGLTSEPWVAEIVPFGIGGGQGIITLNQKGNSHGELVLLGIVSSSSWCIQYISSYKGYVWFDFSLLGENYDFFCVWPLQDAFYYLYVWYHLIETYFSVRSQIWKAVTWFYGLIYFP